jgi:hypothetical protein
MGEYGADLLTFVASVLLALGIAPSPASHAAAKPSLRAIAEGTRYAWSRKELLGTYVIDIAAMLFAMPLAVLPFLADELDAAWSLGHGGPPMPLRLWGSTRPSRPARCW